MRRLSLMLGVLGIFFALAQEAAVAQLGKPGTGIPFKTVVLKDGQGLFGGQNVYVNAKGTCIVQVVVAGNRESRYELALTPGKIKELENLLSQHNFWAIRIPKRPGRPDEANPKITAVPKKGKANTVSKWAGDRHADFDPIYQWLVGVATSAQQTKPSFQGRHSTKWKPKGF